MQHRVVLQFVKAQTHLEDALIAKEKMEDDPEVRGSFEYFLGKARDAMEEYPDELPYKEEYERALTSEDVEDAVEQLANIAGYVREYNGDRYEFSYQSSGLDRVDELANSV